MNGPSISSRAAARIRIRHLIIAWLTLLTLTPMLTARTSDAAEGAAGDIASYMHPAGPGAVAEADPCIFVNDLDFGILSPGQQKSLPLRICNNGRGELTFTDPWLTWVAAQYNISSADIEKLKAARLGPGECVEITVTFVSNSTGAFSDRGTFWSNAASGCRNVSVWTATVTKPGPFISSYNWGDRPVWDAECAGSGAPGYPADVHGYNSGDRNFTVAHVELAGADADEGFFRLERDNPATTIAPGDRMLAGDTNTLRRLQHVIFTPRDAREYSCQILLIAEGTPPDTVRGFLWGRGVASHVVVYDLDFGNYEMVEPGVTIREWSTIVKAVRSNIPSTITVVALDNTTDFSIVGVSRSDGTPMQTPFALTPDEEISVKLAFHPLSAEPHVKEAHLRLTGDFSKCDDSVGLIRAGVVPAGVAGEAVPAGYRFDRITPNPAEGATTIGFTLGRAGRTTIEIFDERGSLVAMPLDRELPAGTHAIPWSLGELPSGVYFCRITSGTWKEVKRIVK